MEQRFRMIAAQPAPNLWTGDDPYELTPTSAPWGYRRYVFTTPLPPGTYRFSAAITSSDTDATTCCVRFMTENDADSSNRSEAQSRIDRTANGESHSLDYVTTAATHHIYLYTSTNSPKSIGDTATYRNIRIERIDTTTGTIDISYWAVDDTVQQT